MAVDEDYRMHLRSKIWLFFSNLVTAERIAANPNFIN